MKIRIDNPRMMEMKNGTKALSFAVVVMEGNGRPMFLINNFRVMDGMVHPPASYMKASRQYYPMAWLYREEALMVYRALGESGWLEAHGLPGLLDADTAILPLLLNALVAARVAPSLLRKPESSSTSQTV